MPTKFTLTVLFSLISTFAIAADHQTSDKTFACEFKLARGCIVGNTEVEMRDGRVHRISFSNYHCAPFGKYGYSCAVRLDRSDGNSRWHDQDSIIRVEEADAFNPRLTNILFAKRLKTGVQLDMQQFSSAGICGAGASLPDLVVVPYREKQCKVQARLAR